MPKQDGATFQNAVVHNVVIKLMTFAVLTTLIAPAQESPLRFQLAIGQTRSVIASACGKQFGPWHESSSDFNASSIGMPNGPWSVYHLTPFEDRMYVTIVHFDSGDIADAIMLEPNGNWSVTQILKDHPSMEKICSRSCEVIQVSEKAGNISLLLKPTAATALQNDVLFFIGDTGSRFKSVTSLDSIVSWGYVLPQSDFEKHHTGIAIKLIGTWKP